MYMLGVYDKKIDKLFLLYEWVLDTRSKSFSRAKYTWVNRPGDGLALTNTRISFCLWLSDQSILSLEILRWHVKNESEVNNPRWIKSFEKLHFKRFLLPIDLNLATAQKYAFFEVLSFGESKFLIHCK